MYGEYMFFLGLKSLLAQFLSWAVELATTLGAAFFGAYWAFKLQEKKELNDHRDKQASALQWASICLAKQQETLLDLYDQYLREFREQDFRHFLYEPISQKVDALRFELKISSLAFICDFNEPELLARVSRAQSNFEFAVGHFNSLNSLWTNQVQDKLGSAEIANFYEVPLSAWSEILGDRISQQLESECDNTFQAFGVAYQQLIEVSEALLIFSKAHFMERKFVKFSPTSAAIPCS